MDPQARQQLESSVEEFFARGGPLSQSLEAWEHRPGQCDMASGVAASLGERRHLVVEAGTGTGKTLAYLVPLALAGKRAVVSTATKNLQEQLVRKDVPFLESVLGQKLSVAVMKGRGNFLCLQKLADMRGKPTLSGLSEVTEFGLIRDWAERTTEGDRAELPKLPGDSKLWPRLDARREACTGRRCALFDDCFVTKMHRRAREADLIVVNHYLFFADLALRKDDFGAIIPDHQAVVFDEAHEIERIVGKFFGVYLSHGQIEELARDIGIAAKRANFGSSKLTKGLKGLRAVSGRFFDCFTDRFGKGSTRERFRGRSEFREGNGQQYRELVLALQGIEGHLGLVKDRSKETDPLRGRVRMLRLTLRILLSDIDPGLAEEAYRHPVLTNLIEDNRGNFVYWLEKRRKGVSVQATPIEVSSILDEALFDGGGGSVILTSATLAVNGEFEFIRGRLGLHSSNEMVVPGHFDFRKQALLYIPRSMPEPKSPDFTPRAAREILELIRLSKGRAFVLCTSYLHMRNLHKRVSAATPFRCLIQGRGSNEAVLEKFRSTPQCVLFATFSFWQGVDVPGEQLSCVIVDKLPFAVPSDPIVEARIDQIRRHGGHPFFDYQIPSAALALKQGFGRLIRATTDRGVLALLDNRLVTKRYGQVFLNSLPDYPRTSDIGDVAKFFNGGGGSRTTLRQAARRRPRRRRAGPGW